MRVLSRRLMRDSEIAPSRIRHAVARITTRELVLETCGEICSILPCRHFPVFHKTIPSVSWASTQNSASNFPTRLSRARSAKNPQNWEISYFASRMQNLWIEIPRWAVCEGNFLWHSDIRSNPFIPFSLISRPGSGRCRLITYRKA